MDLSDLSETTAMWPTDATSVADLAELAARPTLDPGLALSSLGTLGGNDTEHTCLQRYQNMTTPQSDLYCSYTWDKVLCWPPTKAGSTATQSCPRQRGVDTTQVVVKRCAPDGRWERRAHDDFSSPGYTNYSICFGPELRWIIDKLNSGGAVEMKLNVAARTRTLEVVGLSLSLAALLVSLAIFCHFRSLRNNRTRIHKNLFIAMLMQVLIRLALYIDQGVNPSNGVMSGFMHNTPVLCEASYVLMEYARTAMFMWMFIEGLYLHNMVTVTVFQETSYYSLYTLLGWGAPVIMTTAWAVTTAMHAQQTCWVHYNLKGYFWILEGPRLGVVVLNFLFLLNIIRVLVVKLRQSHTSEIEQVRKAVRAAFVLLPLLGITNLSIMTPAPLDRAVWEFALWSYVTHFLTSFQGVFIACLYCFLNGEVRNAITKSVSTFQSLRSHHFQPRRNSAFSGVYVTADAQVGAHVTQEIAELSGQQEVQQVSPQASQQADQLATHPACQQGGQQANQSVDQQVDQQACQQPDKPRERWKCLWSRPRPRPALADSPVPETSV